MTLNHIHIGTKDLKRSVDFYTRLFGFKKKFDHNLNKINSSER